MRSQGIVLGAGLAALLFLPAGLASQASGTLALLGMGLVSLAGYGWHRRRNAAPPQV